MKNNSELPIEAKSACLSTESQLLETVLERRQIMDNITKKILPIMCVISALFLTGCGASVTVKKLNDKDKGIPYYLPKPYLLITRGFSATEYKEKVTETKTEKPDGTMATQTVKEQVPVTTKYGQAAYTMKIIYLPDLRDKYGITINPGIGKSETKLTLENGWKLTSLAENTDTMVAETITATAGLVSALAPTFETLALEIPIPAEKVPERPEAAEEVPEYSICIYEMVWDGRAIKFDLDIPVFEWYSKNN